MSAVVGGGGGADRRTGTGPPPPKERGARSHRAPHPSTPNKTAPIKAEPAAGPVWPEAAF